jgi:hypothetical protein
VSPTTEVLWSGVPRSAKRQRFVEPLSPRAPRLQGFVDNADNWPRGYKDKYPADRCRMRACPLSPAALAGDRSMAPGPPNRQPHRSASATLTSPGSAARAMPMNGLTRSDFPKGTDLSDGAAPVPRTRSPGALPPSRKALHDQVAGTVRSSDPSRVLGRPSSLGPTSLSRAERLFGKLWPV